MRGSTAVVVATTLILITSAGAMATTMTCGGKTFTIGPGAFCFTVQNNTTSTQNITITLNPGPNGQSVDIPAGKSASQVANWQLGGSFKLSYTVKTPGSTTTPTANDLALFQYSPFNNYLNNVAVKAQTKECGPGLANLTVTANGKSFSNKYNPKVTSISQHIPITSPYPTTYKIVITGTHCS